MDLINYSSLDDNVKRSVFGASAIMTIFFGVCLISKWILIALFAISFICCSILVYDLFVKNWLKNRGFTSK